jgi:dipeptidyl aminopeptidase/acylaminoacyl peptidase
MICQRSRKLLLGHFFAAALFVTTPISSFTAGHHSCSFGNVNSRSLVLSMMTSSSSSSESIDKPYGSWESAISSKSITAGSVRLGGLHYQKTHSSRKLYWLEGRPQENGRYALCRLDNVDSVIGDVEEVTPTESNVRTRVHEYGGGAVTFGAADDEIFFSEFATQQLCLLVVGDDGAIKSKPITPDGNRYRFADGVYDPIRKVIFCIREDHENPSPKHVKNEIVAVDVTTGKMTALVTGYDFCTAPRLSPDGKTLACIVYMHPNMPWDATQLVTLDLPAGNFVDNAGDSEELFPKPAVIAGQDGDTSIIQPLWHPQTGHLYYISDKTGYYNIYRSDHPDVPVLSLNADFGGAAPGWSLGQQGYSFLDDKDDGRLVATFNRDGQSILAVADVVNWNVEAGKDGIVDVREYDGRSGLPAMFGGVQGGRNKDGTTDLYMIGGNASTPSSIYKWNMDKNKPAVVLKSSSTLKFDESIISVPRQVQFPTTLGKAYGYYYGPKNDEFKCTTEAAPPLLVKAHGGPTACTSTSFNAGIQFWTSRGFAVLDVDYGGSTGYGRAYRRRLRNAWGIVDIDDVCNGAKYLVNQGLADGKRLCIDGGSAGGYTTLGALAFRDVFQAGCSLYGVGDLTALACDTHKFESRYLDGLVGKYPEDEKIYKERSPIESVASLSCPILLLQGDEDKIVPPNQAEMMHDALLKKGIPTCLKMYKGEQHGFRKVRMDGEKDKNNRQRSFFFRFG